MQHVAEPRKAGRPRVFDPAAHSVQLRFTSEEVARIDAYAARHTLGSRSAAIRALVALALEHEGVDKDVNK